MAERPKIQFRLRDLLWAVSLLGVAIGLWLAYWREFYTLNPFWREPDFIIVWKAWHRVWYFGAFGCLGAAMGVPVRRPWVGAICGVGIAAVAFRTVEKMLGYGF